MDKKSGGEGGGTGAGQGGLRGIRGGKGAPQRVTSNPEDADSSATFPMSDYRVPAHDQKGHSSRLTIRCAPQIREMVSTMVQSGQYPWANENAFGRWCLSEGLERAAKMHKNPLLMTQWKLLNSWHRLFAHQQTELEHMHVVNTAKTAVSSLIEAGHQEKAKEIVVELAEQMHDLEDDYWRKYWTKIVEDWKIALGMKGNGKKKPKRRVKS